MLAPGGRVVFIVPNRSGLWARRDVTPFGFGRPYSFGQLEALLRKHRFAPERHAAALYAPPSHRKFWLQTAHLWERLGRRFDPRLRRRRAARRGLEAGLRPAAAPASKVAVPGPLEVLEGLAGAKPEPVARARPQPRPPRRAALIRTRLRAPHRARGISVLPRSDPLLSPTPISPGRGSAARATIARYPPAGGRGQKQRKGVGVQLSIIDLRGRRPLRDRALRDRQGRQARSTRSRPTSPRVEAALAESADLRDMIASPVFTREEQGKAIAAIAAKMGLGPTVANTLGLMAQNRRLFVLPGAASPRSRR